MSYPRAHVPARLAMPPWPAIAALCCIAASPTLAQAQPWGALQLEDTGFKDGSGHAIAKLFLPGQNVRDRGHLEVKADIRDGKASLAFPALPPGDYAVVVFHDANDNDVIDHSLIGIPREVLGFSNGFALSWSSGLPTFDKLRFAHGDVVQTIDVRVVAP